ncbi:CAP domain-containing protein [Tahibacter amnicola]|uniref:CAP domain-containing protein n=1 Tax=Tahibacter amnicola TaxID=2976241 RepID=A0ABY6BLB6_9GAMM|nr:CAP domain-containing protein [Tahibacter amnicola]UXI69830.1 CAP domain-containing protein [Tahibacter amnicola]
MRYLLAVLSLALPAGASAVFMDCIAIDGFENTVATAPANWRSHVMLTNCARRTALPAAVPALPVMRWDTALAATAQAYADQCRWQHSGAPGLGENLNAAAQTVGFPGNQETASVTNWASEAAQYNYAANSCSGVCGHYTQLVWRSTTAVGCGLRNCTSGSPFANFPNWTIVVCNYSPPGNFTGQRPY